MFVLRMKMMMMGNEEKMTSFMQIEGGGGDERGRKTIEKKVPL